MTDGEPVTEAASAAVVDAAVTAGQQAQAAEASAQEADARAASAHSAAEAALAGAAHVEDAQANVLAALRLLEEKIEGRFEKLETRLAAIGTADPEKIADEVHEEDGTGVVETVDKGVDSSGEDAALVVKDPPVVVRKARYGRV